MILSDREIRAALARDAHQDLARARNASMVLDGRRSAPCEGTGRVETAGHGGCRGRSVPQPS